MKSEPAPPRRWIVQNREKCWESDRARWESGKGAGGSWSSAQPGGVRIAMIWCVSTRLGRSALRIAAALSVVAINGCGSSTQSPKLTLSQAAGLRQKLASVRAAVSAHNRGGAQLALDRFSRLVAQDAAAGAFSSQDLQALRTVITQVRQRIALEVSAPAPTIATPTTAARSPAPAAPGQKDHPKGPHGKGHDHSKGPH